jgi:enoyl-CoA hydratase/carnithine racemase
LAKSHAVFIDRKTFDTQKANELNLLSEIVAKGTQLNRAIEIAQEICIAAPLALQALLASATDAVTQERFSHFRIWTVISSHCLHRKMLKKVYVRCLRDVFLNLKVSKRWFEFI